MGVVVNNTLKEKDLITTMRAMVVKDIFTNLQIIIATTVFSTDICHGASSVRKK
jgi:hypothetical protein